MTSTIPSTSSSPISPPLPLSEPPLVESASSTTDKVSSRSYNFFSSLGQAIISTPICLARFALRILQAVGSLFKNIYELILRVLGLASTKIDTPKLKLDTNALESKITALNNFYPTLNSLWHERHLSAHKPFFEAVEKLQAEYEEFFASWKDTCSKHNLACSTAISDLHHSISSISFCAGNLKECINKNQTNGSSVDFLEQNIQINLLSVQEAVGDLTVRMENSTLLEVKPPRNPNEA